MFTPDQAPQRNARQRMARCGAAQNQIWCERNLKVLILLAYNL